MISGLSAAAKRPSLQLQDIRTPASNTQHNGHLFPSFTHTNYSIVVIALVLLCCCCKIWRYSSLLYSTTLLEALQGFFGSKSRVSFLSLSSPNIDTAKIQQQQPLALLFPSLRCCCCRIWEEREKKKKIWFSYNEHGCCCHPKSHGASFIPELLLAAS